MDMEIEMEGKEMGGDIKAAALQELLKKIRQLIMEMEMGEGKSDASEVQNVKGSNNEMEDAKLAADTEMGREGGGGEVSIEEKFPSEEGDDSALEDKVKSFFSEMPASRKPPMKRGFMGGRA